jgi:iron complex outermembrane receptor protein
VPIALAQTQEQTVIEEVLVTARKRDESIQDIPASMVAFSETDIRSAGIETAQDFINLTPNVTLVQTQNADNSFINIRGVSQARNSEMSAAVLVDDVLMTNPAQFNQQLFDIEQIEVLRGPQGALYGRNAIGRKRGCHSAYLDTFSFQAKPFYERCGYEVFGVLEDFPKGHQRFFMRKSL